MISSAKVHTWHYARVVSEIEPSFRRVVVRRDGRGDGRQLAKRDRQDNVGDGREAGWPEVADWLVRRWVTLAAFALIIGQVAWKSLFLSHFYFRQDDFHFTELGLQYGLSWK